MSVIIGIEGTRQFPAALTWAAAVLEQHREHVERAAQDDRAVATLFKEPVEMALEPPAHPLQHMYVWIVGDGPYQKDLMGLAQAHVHRINEGILIGFPNIRALEQHARFVCSQLLARIGENPLSRSECREIVGLCVLCCCHDPLVTAYRAYYSDHPTMALRMGLAAIHDPLQRLTVQVMFDLLKHQNPRRAAPLISVDDDEPF